MHSTARGGIRLAARRLLAAQRVGWAARTTATAWRQPVARALGHETSRHKRPRLFFLILRLVCPNAARLGYNKECACVRGAPGGGRRATGCGDVGGQGGVGWGAAPVAAWARGCAAGGPLVSSQCRKEGPGFRGAWESKRSRCGSSPSPAAVQKTQHRWRLVAVRKATTVVE